MFKTSLSAIVKMWKQPKQPKCQSTNDKEDVVHTHTIEYYPVIKMNKNLPFVVAWMDGPGRHYDK